MRRLASILLCGFLFAASSCIPQDDYVHPSDAYSELIAAIDYRAKQCGNRPANPLILPQKPPTYGVRLCSISIVRMECPFNDYPPFCLEIFFDLPGIGP